MRTGGLPPFPQRHPFPPAPAPWIMASGAGVGVGVGVYSRIVPRHSNSYTWATSPLSHPPSPKLSGRHLVICTSSTDSLKISKTVAVVAQAPVHPQLHCMSAGNHGGWVPTVRLRQRVTRFAVAVMLARGKVQLVPKLTMMPRPHRLSPMLLQAVIWAGKAQPSSLSRILPSAL